jgi:hypothetical protein
MSSLTPSQVKTLRKGVVPRRHRKRVRSVEDIFLWLSLAYGCRRCRNRASWSTVCVPSTAVELTLGVNRFSEALQNLECHAQATGTATSTLATSWKKELQQAGEWQQVGGTKILGLREQEVDNPPFFLRGQSARRSKTRAASQYAQYATTAGGGVSGGNTTGQGYGGGAPKGLGSKLTRPCAQCGHRDWRLLRFMRRLTAYSAHVILPPLLTRCGREDLLPAVLQLGSTNFKAPKVGGASIRGLQMPYRCVVVFCLPSFVAFCRPSFVAFCRPSIVALHTQRGFHFVCVCLSGSVAPREKCCGEFRGIERVCALHPFVRLCWKKLC